MPLPSSAPSAPLNIALARPDINLAAYTVNPTAITQAVSQGANLGNQLSDEVILRPREVNAQGATADAIQQQQINLQQAALADRANIPLRAANETMNIPLRGQLENTGLSTGITNNQIAGLGAEVQLQAMKDPTYLAGLAKYHSDYMATKAADAGTAATVAKGMEKSAPALADTNSNLIHQNQVAAQGASDIADQDSVKQAKLTAGVNAQLVNAGQSQVALAPFNNQTAMAAQQEGARVAAVNADVVAKAGLARNIQMISMGNAAPPTLEMQEKIRNEAYLKGVQIVDPKTGLYRPIVDISRDYANRMNVGDAAEVLKGTRAESSDANTALETFKGIDQILPRTATGGFESLPGAAIYNNILAGWGNDKAKANQQLAAFQNNLVTEVTKQGGGHLRSGMFDGDYGTFKSSFPGMAQAKDVNANLVAAGIAVNSRISQKNDFYNEVVPSLKAAGADKLWEQYLTSNPLFDPNGSGKGVIRFNTTSLTPQQYMAAIKDPVAAQRSLAPADSVSIGTLPIENLRNPPTTPYVLDAKTRLPKPNPVYWTPIQEAHDQMTVAPLAAQSGPSLQDIYKGIPAALGAQ